MKKIIAIMIFSSLAFTLQEEKIFILDHTTDLKYEIGDGYTRISVSKDDIQLVDSLVSQFVRVRQAQYRWTGRIEDYLDYYRQYVGYKRFSPERIVFVNAFKNKGEYSDEQLRKQLLTARGGGANFFRIKVNLETLQCFDLSVNAPK